MGRRCVVTVVYPKCITVELTLELERATRWVFRAAFDSLLHVLPYFKRQSGVEFIF